VNRVEEYIALRLELGDDAFESLQKMALVANELKTWCRKSP
jgi:predicted DNA-binding protein with PD1-like motif